MQSRVQLHHRLVLGCGRRGANATFKEILQIADDLRFNRGVDNAESELAVLLPIDIGAVPIWKGLRRLRLSRLARSKWRVSKRCQLLFLIASGCACCAAFVSATVYLLGTVARWRRSAVISTRFPPPSIRHGAGIRQRTRNSPPPRCLPDFNLCHGKPRFTPRRTGEVNALL